MSTIATFPGRVAPVRTGVSAARSAADRQIRPGAAPTSSRMRLTRRGRVVLVGLGLAVAAVAGSVAGQAVAGAPAVEQATTTLVVAPGETLWTIAEGITAPGEDVRDVVAVIAELNEMDSFSLMAGEELLLPVS
ncbi:hypothetical protein C8046_04490 [Serinibacter arcticus]|uniref:LysM domain-containing protein n=1 Tax=Serinibacter arcticus TaxID=1655435 RepID=A0A2U1ZSW1_9MICO|nr:LysM peptidoglycan-binding domain-containing protein [Serinibacter arcticus]PWD50040.1 hypothetical protein C8046_04490 [Serinibacter arcticus]